MRKLTAPTENPIDVYDSCVAAIKDDALRQMHALNQAHIVRAVADFNAATAACSWAVLPRVPRGNPGHLVVGDLTKKHLMDLYSDYMVGATGPSRKIYDDLLVAAGGLCPFCGGLGQVHTLDHYLPKASFPLYSVLPANLVPCCRDCNTGKSNTFSSHIYEQTLHPYLDNDKYFEQRWISAEVTKSDPISIKFSCSPPNGWPNADKLRVQQHFLSYRLSYRFSIQAGAELPRLVDLRSSSLKSLTARNFRDFLIDNANSDGFDLNGWSRTMYAALAETEWFCQIDFANRPAI